MKILYVEDNPVDIDLTSRALRKNSSPIYMDTAQSQAEALKIIKGPDFPDYDMVLTDMHLQDGDGIAILSHIRGHSLPVAVVLLTGQGDEEAAVAALKAGADDYIIKKRGYLDKLPSLLEAALLSYQQAKGKDLQPLKVLYIEHNQADVDLTRRHLERYAPHIQLDTIFSVAEFYKIVGLAGHLAEYSALMLDYRLPQENALEILKKIRMSPNGNIPVILITGKGDEEIAVKALKLGAFDYVTKNQGYLFKLPSIIENASYSMRLEREHEALIASENRYRNLFQDNYVVMLLIDPDNGNIIDANSAAVRFYGWSADQIKAKNINEISILPAAAEKNSQNMFLKHRRADGSIRDVEVFSNPIEVGGQALLYSMIYDITERRTIEKEKEKLQRKLIQAQKMEAFGQLAGGIAHDFNNILSAVIGFTELALDEVKKGTPIEEDLQEVYTAGKRAKDLVQQILAFARQTDEETEPIGVSAIAKEVLKLIKSTTPTSVEIKQHLGTHSMIMGNAIQIHQIIMNLCTNAVYAMDEGGILEIALKDVVIESAGDTNKSQIKPGHYIAMKISDTGSGIPQDIINSIYEPYFTTKPPGEGTGMGLAMVHGIVESYGGKIEVESVLAKGTTFTIYLPVANESTTILPYASMDLPQGTERILLVDDEAPIAKMEGKILEKLGYSVTIMTNSAETLKLFTERPDSFDLVMTDATMPNLTGDKLAIELMTIRPDIPIILCTGFNRKITDETAKQLGIKAFSYKPIVTEELAKTVRQVLDEAQKEHLL